MSRSILLVIVLVALFYTASAHGGHKRSLPNMPMRHNKRAVAASTCSLMQCAVSHGNCVTNGTTLVFCPSGEHCSGTTCVDNIALGSACNPTAQENECSSGSCVNTGNGPICQIFQEIMPGNPCTADSQCYYSQTADGSGSVASTCIAGKCAGMAVGQTCIASHQCVAGSFCSGTTCAPLGVAGAACSADTNCNSRFTCLSGACTSRYTQSENQACVTTDNCKPGLYCKGTTCAKATTVSSKAACDISSNNCGADQQCSCNNYVTPNQVATCTAIQGTPTNMPAIEQAAYTCLDKFQCGSDATNSSTVSCIANNCLAEYCTYFTRDVNELFSEYPTCLVSRMVGSQDYYNLLVKCNAYAPSNTPAPTSAGSALSASCAWALVVVLAIFFFEF